MEMHYNRQKIGKYAEDIATSFLKSLNYKIILRNFRCRSGELDIIARARDGFVVVEVRSSFSLFSFDPVDSIRHEKIKKIKKTTSYWMLQNHLEEDAVRFDLLIVRFHKRNIKKYKLQHIKDAF
jgi:putative endonuclease